MVFFMPSQWMRAPAGSRPPGNPSVFICSGGVNPPGIRILPPAKCLDAPKARGRAPSGIYSAPRYSRHRVMVFFMPSQWVRSMPWEAWTPGPMRAARTSAPEHQATVASEL